MIRLPVRAATLPLILPAAALLTVPVTLTAQDAPPAETFSLPPGNRQPAPIPAPAPATETTTSVPVIQPLPSSTVSRPAPQPAQRRSTTATAATPAATPTADAATDGAALPAPAATGSDTLSDPLVVPSAASVPPAATPVPEPEPEPESEFALALPPWPEWARIPALPPLPQWASVSALPPWWPYAAGALGALVLLGGALLLWRRRKPKPLRLAAPTGAGAAAKTAAAPAEAPRLDLALEVTAATRSVMMFTLEYRLTIANRSDRAVNDARLAVQIACARANGASAANAPSAGAAQRLADVTRIGPNQIRSLTGTVQLPLSAIAPLRQGRTPLFVPLVHVTLAGEGLQALAKGFVLGTRSAGGRVFPIPLNDPPGSIIGLVAQAVAVPAGPSAA
ncbi:MAG: hypothetical protein ACKO1N_13330 [Erythrobacter sp.]